LGESTNKNGNKVEGKIGGILKFGFVFKVVEIGNEGIVVDNGKLVNGTIGFGMILVVVIVVVDDVVMFDEDDVEVVELAL
jgi:mRNA degradation ribonuclease J1/J2